MLGSVSHVLTGYLLVKLFTSISAAGQNEVVSNLRQRILNGSDYDDVPPSNQYATNVQVDFYINSISNVQATSMDYWIDVFLTQRWVDHRLIYNTSTNRSVSLPDSLISKLWIPDLFFAKAKQGEVQHITDLSRLLKLNPSTGTVLYSQRIRAQLACQMNLVFFPFDHQNCSITLESWKYDNDLVKLSWMNDRFTDYENKDVDAKLSKALPSLDIDTYIDNSKICITEDENRGNFSCLVFHLTFYRKISFYLWDIYIPSALMVIVTWMSFWIDRKVIQARCVLGSLTMVAISNQLNSVKSVLPKTSQVKAVDVWLWACQFYVLTAFLEFGVVNYLGRREKDKSDTNDQNNVSKTGEMPESNATVSTRINGDGAVNSDEIQLETMTNSSPGNEESLDTQHPTSSSHLPESSRAGQFGRLSHRLATALQNIHTQWQRKKWAERVDLISRYLFPLTFIVFAIIYTAYYISMSGYFYYPDYLE